jgi:2-aminoethylphosphonate-pyruvate transaminase
VHALAALDEALHELDEEGGVAVRQRHYRALNDRLRAGLDARGLRTCFNAPPRSCSLTVAEVPAGQTSDELYHHLLRRGFIVYQAKGALRERCFLIANMGHLQIDTIDRFLDAVADCITVDIH